MFRGVSRTPPTGLKKLTQILVIGSDGDHCQPQMYEAAKLVGDQIAARGAVLVTGGLGGVMEAASKGAKERGGLVVGIIPHEEMSYANPFCDIIVPTGLGFARNYVTAYSADSVIVVGGGAGPLVEACGAYQKGKSIDALTGSGGTADNIAAATVNDRNVVKAVSVSTSPGGVDLS